MCKCKEKRLSEQYQVEQSLLQTIQNTTYTSLIMGKENFKDPVYVRYNGTGGMRPFTGRTTSNRYFFGEDSPTGYVERSDAVEFLTRRSGNTLLFTVEQEPELEVVEQPIIETTAQIVEEPVQEIVEPKVISKKTYKKKTNKE